MGVSTRHITPAAALAQVPLGLSAVLEWGAPPWFAMFMAGAQCRAPAACVPRHVVHGRRHLLAPLLAPVTSATWTARPHTAHCLGSPRARRCARLSTSVLSSLGHWQSAAHAAVALRPHARQRRAADCHRLRPRTDPGRGRLSACVCRRPWRGCTIILPPPAPAGVLSVCAGQRRQHSPRAPV